jgi:hypothetical protein
VKTEKNSGTIAFRFRQVLLFLPYIFTDYKEYISNITLSTCFSYFNWYFLDRTGFQYPLPDCRNLAVKRRITRSAARNCSPRHNANKCRRLFSGNQWTARVKLKHKNTQERHKHLFPFINYKLLRIGAD